MIEHKVGDTYSFKINDSTYKGLQQVAEDLGWMQRGMRKGAKAKKKKVCGGDLFINLEERCLCRVMRVSADATGDKPPPSQRFPEL